MLLNDEQIIRRCHNNARPMITPFSVMQVREIEDRRLLSYGTSSFGYDARCDRKFKVFHNVHGTEVDPKNFDPAALIEVEAGPEGFVRLPPHSFTLTQTMERFDMPPDVLAICVGKSTYARCGLIINVTPLEPGWAGTVTIEISNTTPNTVRVYAGEGICQFLFLRGELPIVRYDDRDGKYMNQSEITLPRV